jgi:peptidoglycan LD-endopeptidase LytH
MRKLIVVAYFVGIVLLAWTAAGIREPHQASPALINVPADALVIPVVGVKASDLRDSFTAHRTGHDHRAIDILTPRGTPVVAAVDGNVRKLFTSADGGITIYETDPANTMIYYYAHLDHYADGLREGLPLRRGDVIGYVGTTGNAPRNTPHLHFAIVVLPPTKEWWKGDPIDPYPILKEHGVTVEVGRGSQVGGR